MAKKRVGRLGYVRERQKAKKWYIKDGLDAETIHARLPYISITTIRNWINGKRGDKVSWKVLREEYINSDMHMILKLKQTYPKLIEQLKDTEKIPKAADALTKVLAAVNKIGKNANVDMVAKTFEVMNDFLDYLNAIDVESASLIMDFVDGKKTESLINLRKDVQKAKDILSDNLDSFFTYQQKKYYE